MNLILFEPGEIDRPLSREDRRARHLLDVLRRQTGDRFDAGIVNGPRGQGVIRALSASALDLGFSWQPAPPPPERISLIVGLPRPQTARDILRDATTLGVATIRFVATEKGEPSYAQSTLWSSGEWRRHLLAGAEQAFTTRIPDVIVGQPLSAAVPAAAGTVRLALDNYEAASPLSQFLLPETGDIVLAVGGERGWSAAERELLRAAGFSLHHLGDRVLRTETACLAALTLVRARLGLM